MTQYRRPPLNSAEFNIREIAKQLLLLEDHLADDEKYCKDCIRKHLLMVEALAEEAVTLDPDSPWVGECRTMADRSRGWMIAFTDGVEKSVIARRIRLVRKRVVAENHDPRKR